MAVDDGFTKTLLHGDGSDASTTITDDSLKTWTASGDAQIDTAQQKFGTGSILFDGVTDYISTPDHDDFYFGTDPFTIDFWFRDNTSTATHPDMLANSFATWQVGCFAIRYHDIGRDSKVSVHEYTLGDPILESVNTFATATWHHVAVIRESTTVLKLYVNGVLEDTFTLSGSTVFDLTYGGSSINIGRNAWDGSGAYFKGWIDEVRISKGIARWTANFAVPTAAYSPLSLELSTSLSVPLTIAATMVRGLTGDIYDSSLVIPISISGTILCPSVVTAPLIIPISMSGTMNTPVVYESTSSGVTLPALTCSGEGLDSGFGDASIDLPFLTLESEGIVGVLADGTFEIPALTVSGEGLVSVLGEALLTLPRLTLEVESYINPLGNLSVNLPMFTLSAEALRGATGSLNQNIPPLTISATGILSYSGTGAVTLPMMRI